MAGKALHVHLAGRLGEGEVVGAEPGLGVLAVEALDDFVQGALQIGHGNALVHHHALDLVEHGGVSGVCLVLPVDPAGGDDADGRLAALHGADLHGRGLGAEEDGVILGIVLAGGDIEGVRPLTAWVTLLGVQLGKVVGGKLHLRAFCHVEAHADKDIGDLVDDLGDRVLVTKALLVAGDGDVHCLRRQLQIQCGLCKQLALGGNGVREGSADFIGQLTYRRALLRRQLARLLQESGQLALFAQILDPDGVQSGGGVGSADGGQRLGPDLG